jgi:hypothetical protein
MATKAKVHHAAKPLRRPTKPAAKRPFGSVSIRKDPKGGSYRVVKNTETKVVRQGPSDSSPVVREEALSQKLLAEVAATSSDVNTLCERYHLKREELGRLTGFSLRALAEWSAGKLPSAPAKRRLHETRRLLDAVAEIVRPEFIPEWLHRPNSAFDNMTPLQTIEVGEIDRLWTMVHRLGSGQPG